MSDAQEKVWKTPEAVRKFNLSRYYKSKEGKISQIIAKAGLEHCNLEGKINAGGGRVILKFETQDEFQTFINSVRTADQ